PSRATRPADSASRYSARAAEERAADSPHTVMNRRLTALAPSPVGSRWLAAPAANWVTTSRRPGSRSSTAPCRVQAAAGQVRQVAPAAASSHGQRAWPRWANPSARTDRCRTATTVTSSGGSTHSTRRIVRVMSREPGRRAPAGGGGGPGGGCGLGERRTDLRGTRDGGAGGSGAAHGAGGEGDGGDERRRGGRTAGERDGEVRRRTGVDLDDA